jgi:apolipoprotein N-acyltransferase
MLIERNICRHNPLLDIILLQGEDVLAGLLVHSCIFWWFRNSMGESRINLLATVLLAAAVAISFTTGALTRRFKKVVLPNLANKRNVYICMHT